MADKIVNTRLILRNDTIANWNTSTKTLLKGEAALARLEGELSDSFQLRIGTGDKTWSQLEPSNIIIPSQNISCLTYDEYQLSGLAVEEGEEAKFQLVGRNPKTKEWTAIGSAITIPEVDFGPVTQKIDYLSNVISTDISNAISTITATTIPEAKTELSATLSSYTDSRISELSGAADATIKAVSAETLVSAYADATAKATQALTDAKDYTDAISSEISATTQSQIDEIKNEIAGGIHFIGHVFDFGVDETKTPHEGWYQLTEGAEKTAAKAGDLIIKNEKEYIWSDAQKHWDEFGDEGNYATKAYVDNAKQEAINAAKNTVQTVASYDELTDGVNTGDVGLVKTEIGSTGKYEISAFTWNATTEDWVPMDAYYSADKVIMPENMIITEKFGKYEIPSTGSKELTCAGMTVKAFINDAFAQTRSADKTNPVFTLTVNGGTGEIGTKYTVPAATLKMTDVGSYQYGPETGITVPVNNAVIKATKTGYEQELSNSTAMELNSTISTTAGTANAETYLSSGTTYTYTAAANYTEGAVPKNNIGADDPDNKIPAGSFSDSKSATFTGYFPAYYAFTTSPTANPTAITATNGNVTVDGVTYTRDLNSFSKTSFKTTSKWYELFYLVPQAKRTSSGWTGKDSNNVDLAVEAKTTATVTFLDGTTAIYNVYVVRNAAQYSATTCTMTYIA